MNFIILLLSIGLLLIPGCHKSPTVEEIILNDPFLVTHTYFWYYTLISSDALQAVKDKKMSQEEQDTAKTACIKILENAQPLLENGDNADGSMNMDRRLLEAGLNRLLSNNNCLAIFRNPLGVKNPPTLIFPISNSINFPIVKGALYDYAIFNDYKGYYAIVTFEDFIKNKQLIQEFYFEGEGANVKLDKILVTGKVESKGYFYQADVNKEIYSLVIRPESMPHIKIITLAAFNKSAEVMQESKINDNYKLECFILGDKQRITEDNSHEDLVYIMDKCNPLIPERFDYKPDKIERVNNYLKNMIQCKHNELYFDGKCHNILPELPKTDIPSNNAVDSSNTNNTTIMQIHADNSTSPCDGIDFYGQCTKLNGTVTFGRYPQNTDIPEPIEWRVLNKNDKGQILLISEKVLDRKTYYTREIAAITWEKSTIRSWLNGYTASYNTAGINFTNDNFINKAFTAEEQTKIINSNIPAHNNPDFNIPPGNATTDKIFLLSTVEAANYFPDNAARQADATRYVVKKGEFVLGSESTKTTSDGTCSDNHCYASWWLRSPGGTSGVASGADVSVNGSINTIGCIVEYPSGIRPAMWVTLAKRAYSEPTPPPTIPNVSNSVKSTQSIPSTGEQARVADIPPVPTLIPAPAVTNPPEQRLTFKKSIKTKKGKVEYLIFRDSQLNTDCYVSMLGNQEVLNDAHYCIPFSGDVKLLTHPTALTKTAESFKHYTYCTNISFEKRNIPGLAGFFEAFNPSYYHSNLKRFIDNPFQITKPQNKDKKTDNCGGTCRPHDVECVQNFYSQTPDYACNLGEANRSGQLTTDMLDTCKLNNPFITYNQYKQYNLKPGDVFLTSSAKQGERVLHQYWQVFDMNSLDYQFNGTPEYVWEYNTCRNTIGQYGEPIVQVRDLSSKDTYDVLYTPIMQGMKVRDDYCKAFNNTLINEARAGHYALIDASSPLLKKK